MNEIIKILDDISTYHAINNDDMHVHIKSADEEFLTVAVIGMRNTGKSTLINSVLGIRLLPTGLTPRICVPTTLKYSENRCAHLFFAVSERTIGIDSLFDEHFSLSGIKAVAIEYNHVKLSGIRIVELPGDITGVSSSLIGRVNAAVLVFSADEPVLRETTITLCEELKVSEIPVLAVVNKCDKIPAEIAKTSASRLKTQIKECLHFTPEDIIVTSLKHGQGVLSADAFLVRCRNRAERLREKKKTDILTERCSFLASELSKDVELGLLSLDKIKMRVLSQRAELDALNKTLSENDRRYTAAITECITHARQFVADVLRDNRKNIEDFMSLQDTGSLCYELAVGTLVSSLRHKLWPVLERRIILVLDVLKLYGLDEFLSDEMIKERERSFNEELAILSGADELRNMRANKNSSDLLTYVPDAAEALIKRISKNLERTLGDSLQAARNSREHALNETRKASTDNGTLCRSDIEEKLKNIEKLKKIKDELCAVSKD